MKLLGQLTHTAAKHQLFKKKKLCLYYGVTCKQKRANHLWQKVLSITQSTTLWAVFATPPTPLFLRLAGSLAHPKNTKNAKCLTVVFFFMDVLVCSHLALAAPLPHPG